MKKINFIDTTLRDAHQSLWATRMTTAMMYPIAPVMDAVGFAAMDFTAGGSIPDAQVRYLRENPWDRIRLMVKAMPRTPLSAGLRSKCLNSFDIMPDAVVELWIRRVIANGIRRFWVFDALHDFSNIANAVRVAKTEGVEVVVPLIYSLSPIHTDEFYAQKAREIVELGVDNTYIKDPGGLLTPERVRTLVPAIQKNLNGLPLGIHSHCTTGLAPLVYLEAIKLGVTTVHTAISPMANGSSNPSTENIIKNARHLGYSIDLDEEALKTMAAHFRYVAQREGLPMGVPVEYDASYYDHQVPGGMITNLKSMLAELRMEHKLEEVLEEVALVRQELAYPIMVTPFSQLVGTQAALNVALGERYKAVTDEVIKYALGYYGKLPVPVDQNVMDRIMSLPRAKDFLNWVPPQPSIADLRQKIGTTLSDEELLLRIMYQEEHVNAMLAAGPMKTDYPGPEKPVVELIEKLMKRGNAAYIRIQKGGFCLSLRKDIKNVQ